MADTDPRQTVIDRSLDYITDAFGIFVLRKPMALPVRTILPGEIILLIWRSRVAHRHLWTVNVRIQSRFYRTSHTRWRYDKDERLYKAIQSTFILSLLRIFSISRLVPQKHISFFFTFRQSIVTMPALTSHGSDLNIEYKQIFINNEWHKASSGKTFPVTNPSTGGLICQIEEGTKVGMTTNKLIG